MVSILDFCSNEPSLILAGCQVFQVPSIPPREDEINEKEAGKGPSFKKLIENVKEQTSQSSSKYMST